MKQLFAAILCLCLLAGCGRTDSTGNTCRAEDEPTVGAEKAEPIGESFRIIQEKPDWLLLAKEEGDSAEVYTLSLSDTELTLDGEVFERNEPGAYQRFPDGTLTGALVEVAYDLVLETYPSEQAAVAWVFGGMHDISETMTMSYEELAAEGYLSDTASEVDGIPHWKDGCLFTITEQNGQDSIHVEQDSKNITGADPLPRTEEESGAACQLPPAEAEQGQSDFCQPVKTEGGEPDALQNTVTFDAQKWRSALGAYFFADCTASRDAQGHWGDYTVGAAAIS